MALATREVQVTQKVIETEEDVVLLSLSRIEAAALKAIMQRIGGNPLNTVRKYSESIEDALISVGVKWQNQIPCEHRDTGICFAVDSIKHLDIS